MTLNGVLVSAHWHLVLKVVNKFRVRSAPKTQLGPNLHIWGPRSLEVQPRALVWVLTPQKIVLRPLIISVPNFWGSEVDVGRSRCAQVRGLCCSDADPPTF